MFKIIQNRSSSFKWIIVDFCESYFTLPEAITTIAQLTNSKIICLNGMIIWLLSHLHYLHYCEKNLLPVSKTFCKYSVLGVKSNAIHQVFHIYFLNMKKHTFYPSKMDARQTCTHRYMNKYYTVEDDTSKRGQTHTHTNEKNEK